MKDGGSNDRTLELIPESDRIIAISKLDNSIYDAMNQAVRYVNGRYVIFMNCGDTFYSNTVLEKVSKLIKENKLSDEELIYGNYCKGKTIYYQPHIINKSYLIRAGLCHQTVFFGSELFKKYGDFNTRFTICADYEIMVRLFMQGIPYIYIEETICNYLGGGVSEKAENIKIVKNEGAIIRRKYFSVLLRFLYIIRKVTKYFARKV